MNDGQPEGLAEWWKEQMEFNIAPEIRPSQKENSLPNIIFQGAMLNFRGVIFF